MHKVFFSKVLLVVVSSLIPILHMQGQPLGTAVGMRALGVGGIYTVFGDAFTAFNNPAAVQDLEGSSIGLSVQNRFGISDLNVYHLGVVQRINQTNYLSLGIGSMGIEGFSENHFLLGYGLALSEFLFVGVRTGLIHYFLVERGHHLQPIADLGSFYKLNQRLSFGIVIHNPFQISRIKEYNDYMPVGASFGTRYTAGEQLFLFAEISKFELLPAQFKAGIEWGWKKHLWLRTGYSHTNSAFSLGLGWGYKTLRVNLAFVHVALPGGISGADVSYIW